MHQRRAMASALIGAWMLWSAAALQPPSAAACLPYQASQAFSFDSGLAMAIVGHVDAVIEHPELINERVGVVITVDRVIAGPPVTSVDVRRDSGGGCSPPRGEPGDLVVIARGYPGPDGMHGGHQLPPELSPYNTATWVIIGELPTGPTLDGVMPATVDELIAMLSSLPDTSLRQVPSVAAVGMLLLAIVVIGLGVLRSHLGPND